MENFYKVSNTIENGPRMDRKRTVDGPRMDRVKSRISPMNHRLWTVIAPMLFVAFGLFGVNEKAWGGTVQGYASVIEGKGSVKVQMEVWYVTWGGGEWRYHSEGSVVDQNAANPSSISHSSRYDVKRCKFVVVSNGTGYTFGGWYKEESNGSLTYKTSDGTYAEETVTGLADRTYTYRAKFNPITYKISFNSNPGTGTVVGSTADVTGVKYDQDATLTTNGYQNIAYVVTYDANGGSGLSKAKDSTFYDFDGWTKGDNTYADGATVRNLSSTDGGTATLYAKWGSGTSSITLPPAPSVAKPYDGEGIGEYSFAGWYLSTDGTQTVIGVTGDSYTPTANVTLKAKWTAVKVPAFSAPGFVEGSKTLTVGGTYDDFIFSNTSTSTPSNLTTAKFYYRIFDEEVKTDNTDGCLEANKNKVISFDGTTITALNKGTAKIAFYQKDDTDKNIEERTSDTYTINVNKNVPSITFASAPYYYNATINNFYSSDNSATSISAESDNTEVASISGSTLTTYNKAGTAQITVSQAENYYWAYHEESVDVTPQSKANHVPYTITNSNYEGIEVSKTSNVAWITDGSYKLGTGDWGTSKSDDNVIISLEGIPDKLSFTLSCDPVQIAGTHYPSKKDYTFEVYESATNGNWGNKIWGNDNSSGYSAPEDVQVQLSASTRYIKLRYTGTCWGRFNNIQVTELQYFRRQGENSTLDFATNVKNHVPPVQSFVVEHANAGYQTSVTAPEHYLVSKDNVNFASEVVYSTNATAETGGDIIGTFTVYVKYLADAVGTHNANVTVHNNLRSDFNVPVTGTTKDKIATQIEYCGASSYSVDAANIASTTLFRVRDTDNDTIVTGVGISLSCEENEQFSIAGGNALDPECGGTNNVKPSFAGNDTYAAATNNNANFAITITRLADEISFDNARSTLVVGDEIDLSDWASAESESEITYEVMSSDQLTGSIKIENGKLIALSAGTVRIKATSEGNCLYDSGYDFHNMKVRNPGDPCGSLLLDKSATVKCGVTANTSESPQEYVILAGPMDELKFKIWRVATAGDQVTIRFVDKDGNAVPNGTYTYSAGSLGTSKPDNYTVIDVSNITGATKLQIYGGGLLNKYVSNVQITQKAYLTTYVGSTQLEPTANVTMPEVKACNTSTKDITIKYSDLTPIQLSHTNDVFTYEIYKGENKVGFFDNDCRGFGTYTVRCICTPTSKGEYSDVLTLTASGQSQTINLSLNATAPEREIVWDIPTGNTITATQSLDLTAYAETSCQSPAGSVYYTASPADAVTIDPIDGNHITFNKAATVTVTAHTVTSEDYNDAPTVDKVWTVGKIGTQMRTLPTITSTITYGDNSSVVTYDNNSWVAEDTLNHEVVTGIIVYNGPASFDAAGQQNLTFYFYPTVNAQTYDVCLFTVPVTVQQMASVATPVAANITYGHRVNESVLTSGEGSTTPGTWSWKDEAANTQVLDASADAYTGLNVIFTPDDSNYATIETTVSLKVDKADPEATVSNVGITYGAIASSVTLSGTGVAGTWSWTDTRKDQVLAAGSYTMNVHFIPNDATNYNEKDATVSLTVKKADPVATANAVEITYGATASSVDLEGTGVAGTWSWTDTRKDQVLAAGSYTMNVHFIPNDATNYNEKDATVALTVNKADPAVTPQATDITYGQPVSASNLTTASGDVAGTWAWAIDDTQVLSVGDHVLKANFTSDSANYNNLSNVDVTLKVNKIETLEVEVPLSFCAGGSETFHGETYTTAGTDQINAVGATRDTVYNVTVTVLQPTTGTDSKTITVGDNESWNGIDLSGYAVGSHEVVFHTTNVAGCDSTVTLSLTVNAVVPVGPNTFMNNAGDNDWQNAENWTNGVPSGVNPDVIISGALIIDESVTVGGLTILPTGGVTVITHGTLTVNGTTADQSGYGDLYVANGGEVEVTGSLIVRDLIVEASIGTSEGNAESGQVASAENIVYTNAYIDINMDPEGHMDDTKWYGFTVPFAVDAYNGVSRLEGTAFRQCVYGTDYLIAEYDANKRLNSGNGWKFISGSTLNAGQFYFLTVDGSYNTYRFKASGNSYTPAAAASLSINGDISNSHANWNGVGNSTLQHVTASYTGGEYVQVYKNGKDAYMTLHTSDANFVVGCPFFIQAQVATTLLLSGKNTLVNKYYAPRRMQAEATAVSRINLSATDGGYSDQIYFSAVDKEQDAYIIGQDLAKAGVSTVVPQLWMAQYNQKLSVHEATWNGDRATCPLGIYVPKNGEYVLTATQPEDGTQIYLTENGAPIWDLTMSEYVLSLEKGNTSSYGLMIVRAPQVTTGVEDIQGTGAEVRKVIIDNTMYIITPEGTMFNVIGKKVQ